MFALTRRPCSLLLRRTISTQLPSRAPPTPFPLPPSLPTENELVAEKEDPYAPLEDLLIEGQRRIDGAKPKNQRAKAEKVIPKANQPEVYDIPPAEDPLLRYLTSQLMTRGLRHRAERRLSRLLTFLYTKTGSPPLPLVRTAFERAAPSIKVVSWKRGGRNIQTPRAIGERERVRFAFKWMLDESWNQPGRTVEERLAREMIAILNGESGVLGKKNALHKVAVVNRGAINT